MSIWNISINIAKSALENSIERDIGESVKKETGTRPNCPKADQREIVRLTALKKLPAKNIARVSNKKVSLSNVIHVLNNYNMIQHVTMSEKLLYQNDIEPYVQKS